MNRSGARLRALRLPLLVLCLLAWPAAGWTGAFEEGLNYFDGGHYRWALEKFIEASDQLPRDPARWWYMAESYRMLGDNTVAANLYRQILQTAAQSPYGVASRQALDILGEPAVASFRIAIQRRGGSAFLPARVNGQELGVFILDTGASYTSVSTFVAKRLGISTSGGATIRLITASGVIQAPLALLDEIDIGGAISRHVPVVVHDLPSMPSNVVGLLGMSFLERFRMNLDMSSGYLILESGN